WFGLSLFENPLDGLVNFLVHLVDEIPLNLWRDSISHVNEHLGYRRGIENLDFGVTGLVLGPFFTNSSLVVRNRDHTNPAPLGIETSDKRPFNPAPCPFAFNLYRRSEEHTSELQSRENLVCRLLLE